MIKNIFTKVLKGHIAVAISRFNKDEKGRLLDKKARQYLVKYNKNFEHGTGHGVGSFLNVHEGPHTISSRGMYKFREGHEQKDDQTLIIIEVK